jgi:hypothetical protein
MRGSDGSAHTKRKRNLASCTQSMRPHRCCALHKILAFGFPHSTGTVCVCHSVCVCAHSRACVRACVCARVTHGIAYLLRTAFTAQYAGLLIAQHTVHSEYYTFRRTACRMHRLEERSRASCQLVARILQRTKVYLQGRYTSVPAGHRGHGNTHSHGTQLQGI